MFLVIVNRGESFCVISVYTRKGIHKKVQKPKKSTKMIRVKYHKEI